MRYAHALVRSHRNHPAFPTQWFYGFLRALPGDRLSCHPRLRKLPFANLTPAPGRQDHTTSPSANSHRPSSEVLASTASRSAFRDVARRPSQGAGRRDRELICDFGKPEYFCKRGLTEGAENRPGDLQVAGFTCAIAPDPPQRRTRPEISVKTAGRFFCLRRPGGLERRHDRTFDIKPAAAIRRTHGCHQGAPLRLRLYQRAQARPRRIGRSLVQPALPPRLRRRHRNRRASRRRRHRHARRDLRHGRAARARRDACDRHARPAHRLPEARDPRPRHQGALGLLPRHPLDRLRARHRLPGCRGRSRRHRNRLLHDRRQPDQHADRRAAERRRAAGARGAGRSGRPVRQQSVRAFSRHPPR